MAGLGRRLHFDSVEWGCSSCIRLPRSLRGGRLQRSCLHGGCLSALLEPLHTPAHYSAGHSDGTCSNAKPCCNDCDTKHNNRNLNHDTPRHNISGQVTAMAQVLYCQPQL